MQLGFQVYNEMQFAPAASLSHYHHLTITFCCIVTTQQSCDSCTIELQQYATIV